MRIQIAGQQPSRNQEGRTEPDETLFSMFFVAYKRVYGDKEEAYAVNGHDRKQQKVLKPISWKQTMLCRGLKETEIIDKRAKYHFLQSALRGKIDAERGDNDNKPQEIKKDIPPKITPSLLNYQDNGDSQHDATGTQGVCQSGKQAESQDKS